MQRANSDTFEDVVAAIYEVACEPSLWPDLLTRVADHIGSTGGLVVRHGERPWIAVGRLDPDLTRLYMARHSDNLYARRFAMAKPGVAYRANHVVDVSLIRRTEFHADILAPQNVADMATISYAEWCRGAGAGGLSFMMDPKRADRGEELVRKLSRLAPHLTRTLDLGRIVQRSDRERDLAALLALSERPTLLCDARHVVRFANAAAEALLKADDGLSALRGLDGALRLQPILASDARALGIVLNSAAAVASGIVDGSAGGAVRIARPSGRAAYLVCAAPLPRPSDPWTDRTDPCVLVTIVDPHAESPRGTAAALRIAYGLTAAEARIAALVARGSGVPGAARRCGVSQETVRRQLHQCFDKTGARSQVELARLVAMLPVNGLAPGGADG